ncbi:MAG: response regulator [Sulfitobacter sp.]|nr:response regulator [Sulfitobacter sp.]
MRILAVDDDPVILDLLPVVLRQADLPQITLASSAMAALDILRQPENRFDCLLLDIMMEDMDGIDLCARIRRIPSYQHTPILMLTAVKDHAEIEAAFAAGANDYITKPFDVKEIATRVRVAQRMSETTAHVRKLSHLPIEDDVPPGQHRFDLQDPIMLEQCQRLILPFSLGNYLSQLSRSRLDTCTIFAVRIEEIARLYNQTKSHEFAILLGEIVKSIKEAVDCPKLLMSYEGDGTILCIQLGSDAPLWPEIEDEVQAILDDRGLCHDDGTPISVSLSIGNPVVPNASRNQRVKKTFERAIGRAVMREKSKAKAGNQPIRRIPRRKSLRGAF